MAEVDYIVDEAGNKIVTDEGDYIVTEGDSPTEGTGIVKRPYLGLSLGISMGTGKT